MEAPATSLPWFFTVSETINDIPAPATPGTTVLDSMRSGPILVTDAFFVLFSSCVSGTTPVPSAFAMM